MIGTGMIKTSHELLKNAKHNCPYEKNLRQDDADKLMKHIPGEWHGVASRISTRASDSSSCCITDLTLFSTLRNSERVSGRPTATT